MCTSHVHRASYTYHAHTAPPWATYDVFYQPPCIHACAFACAFCMYVRHCVTKIRRVSTLYLNCTCTWGVPYVPFIYRTTLGYLYWVLKAVCHHTPCVWPCLCISFMAHVSVSMFKIRRVCELHRYPACPWGSPYVP